MQPDELDRLLSQERPIIPSASFAASVMGSVLREAETPKGIGFPWKPVLAGILSAAAAVVAGLAMQPPSPVLVESPSTISASLESWSVHMADAAANPVVGALVLTVLVALVPMVVYQGYQRVRG